MAQDNDTQDNKPAPPSRIKRALTSLGLAGALAGSAVGAELKATPQAPKGTIDFPNPFDTRTDMRGQEELLLVKDKTGKPAFLNWWPEGTPPEQRVLNLSIISKLPELTGEERRDPSFKAMVPAFTRISDRTEKILRDYAGDFQRTYGITLNISHDAEKPDIVIGAYDSPNAMHAGFASFPPNAQGVYKKFSKKSGYVYIDERRMAQADEAGVRNLFDHEFGHAIFGTQHTFDSNVDQNKLNQTSSYSSTMTYRPYRFVPPQEGVLGTGPLNLAVRPHFKGGVPPITSDNATVDMQAINNRALTNMHTANSGVFLPAQAVFGGTNNSFYATSDNDMVDLNAMTASQLRQGQLPGEQNTIIMQGGFDRVSTGAGNDVIILRGGQEKQLVMPGGGTNEVHMYYPNTGDITLHSEGKDTLVILDKALAASTPTLIESSEGMKLAFNWQSSFTLTGNGLAAIKVVDGKGKALFEADTAGMDAQSWEKNILPQLREIAKPQWQTRTASLSDKSPQQR